MKTNHRHSSRKAQELRRAARKERAALKTEVAPQEQVQSCIYMQGAATKPSRSTKCRRAFG